ncbi:iron-binding protein [Orobanche hederae]
MLRQIANTNLGRQLRSSAAVGGGGLRRMYHERVVDHGTFDKNGPNVGTGLVGAPAFGDVMNSQQIRVDDIDKIVYTRLKTFGCGSPVISPSVTREWMKVRQMEDVLTIKNTNIAEHLSLPPVKLHYSMLAEDAIKAAVKDYEAKRTKVNESQEAADA